MTRTSLLAAVTCVCFLLLPARLMAGGPPCLCLPIDGVTADNVKGCTELLNAKLKHKLWTAGGERNGVQIQQRAKQWYLMFYMAEDVRLQDIESALSGSKFSIPRDRIHLFGHVILEIDASKASSKELVASLGALGQVTVPSAKGKKEHLSVTLDMPYPVGNGRPESDSVALDQFQRNDLSSDQSTKGRSPVSPQMLPSYNAIRDVVTKHNANLQDIHWSTDFACRMVGCVAVPRPAATSG